jgi:hypothetical protein
MGRSVAKRLNGYVDQMTDAPGDHQPTGPENPRGPAGPDAPAPPGGPQRDDTAAGESTPGGPRDPDTHPEPENHPTNVEQESPTPEPTADGHIHARTQAEQVNEELQEENAESALDQPSDSAE